MTDSSKHSVSVFRLRSPGVVEAPRLKKFRLGLVKEIPRFPNTKEAHKHMLEKALSSVIVDYVNWRSRYVGVRARKVEVEPAALIDRRWWTMSAAVQTFLEKVRNGDDLTPHLSIAPHTRGYAFAAHAVGATIEDRWSDKDQLLIRMGYHHFHLGLAIEKAGHVARTDELLFAEVSRENFKVIAIFDHDVFEQESAERRRLRTIHENIIFRRLPPGAGVMQGPVMSSGHAMHVAMYAQRCGRLIEATEPQLDNRKFVENLYSQGKVALPAKPKLGWAFLHLDLAIYDGATKAAFCVQQAWN